MRMWCGRAGHMLDSDEPSPEGVQRLELCSALVASLLRCLSEEMNL